MGISAPVMNAARAERVPLVLLNLDAVAGKANRWVGRRAGVRLTAASGPRVPSDWEVVRPVVRESATPRGSVGECRQRLGLDALGGIHEEQRSFTRREAARNLV